MSCRRRNACNCLLILACVVAAACARRPADQAQPQRLAILRFENLTPDDAAGWMGRAFSEAISSELSADPSFQVLSSTRLHSFRKTLGVRPVSAPGISAERQLAIAAGATRVGYGDYSTVRGRLLARLTVEDLSTGRMWKVVSASAPRGDVIAAAEELARQVSTKATSFGTHSEEALQAYVTALEGQDAGSIESALRRATAADPEFGAPYEMLVQVKAQQQDRAGALAVLDAALAHAGRMPPAMRARLEVQKADLANDSAARDRAMAALAAAAPRDPAVWRSLAETSYTRRDFGKAVEAFRKLVELEPQDFGAWNQLAYAAANNHDFIAAAAALKRYQDLRPGDPNPADSLGDVNLMFGRLREAENLYLGVARKNPTFLNSGDFFKAAMARLMSGDIAGADAIAKQYMDARTAAHASNVEALEAEWAWGAGRRREAAQRMEAYARKLEGGNEPASAAGPYGELAIWSIFLGDREAADRYAQRAVTLGGGNPAVMVARFLSLPGASAQEWTARADRIFPNPGQSSIRDLALADALLVNRQFDAASGVLRRLYDSPSFINDPGIPVQLAWALVESGHAAEAAPLLALNPVPPPSGPGALMPFYFPRVYELRAAAAEKSGRAEEARTSRELYLKLKGAEPLI